MIILDRREGMYGVLETDDGMINVPLTEISDTAREGDVLLQTNDGYIPDAEAAEQRRQKMAKRMQRMCKK